MCWVIPPASESAMLALRIWSRSFVLPWSTWPITVITGGRGGASSGRSSSSISSRVNISVSCSSPGSTRMTSAPISAANNSIMSSVNDWVAVIISPCCMRNRTRSAAVRFNFDATSWAELARSTTTSPSGTAVLSGV